MLKLTQSLKDELDVLAQIRLLVGDDVQVRRVVNRRKFLSMLHAAQGCDDTFMRFEMAKRAREFG